MHNELPSMFLWHKAGTEASLDLVSTLNVKEKQRCQNDDGIFLWGLGSGIRKERLQQFLDELSSDPCVVITHIVSNPRPQDVEYIDTSEKTLRVWESATEQLSGKEFSLPEGSQVVSTATSRRPFHWALVCQSDEPVDQPHQTNIIVDPAAVKIFDNGDPVKGNGTLFPVAIGEPNTPPYAREKHVAYVIDRLAAPYLVKLGSPRLLEKVKIDPVSGRYPV